MRENAGRSLCSRCQSHCPSRLIWQSVSNKFRASWESVYLLTIRPSAGMQWEHSMLDVHKSGCSHDFWQAYWNTQVFNTVEALQIPYAPLPQGMIYIKLMTTWDARSLKNSVLSVSVPLSDWQLKYISTI